MKPIRVWFAICGVFFLSQELRAQFTYTTNNGAITLVGYSGPGGAVDISNFVTYIGQNAFVKYSSLTSITIPNSVTAIGAWAFIGTGLTSVTIPESVTNIGDSAFAFCTGLTSVVISSSVTSIGADAFTYTALTNVTIPQGVTNIAGMLFFHCFSLTNAIIPFGVTSIDGNAFAQTGLTSVTIPDSVTDIQEFAFETCGDLLSVTIPSSVTSIDYSAFATCWNLTNVIIADGVTNLGSAAFYNTSLTCITIPASVTFIGEGAFEYCYDLSSLYFKGNAPAVYDSSVFLYDNNPTVYYLPGTTGWDEFSTNAGVPTVLWNPLIQAGASSFGLSNNNFGFNITGTTNIPIVLEACTNLANPVWTPLTNITLTNGLFYFSESFQPNSHGRFYRISSP